MDKAIRIPNLCKNSSVFAVVLVTELFALLIALVRFGEQGFAADLGFISLYCQWLVLPTCALLCIFRKSINKMRKLNRLFSMGACFLAVLVFLEIAIQLIFGGSSSSARGSGVSNMDYVMVRIATAIICAFLLSRYFIILALLEVRNRAEMSHRMQALQSRIKPHFLFNALNTVMELINTDPQRAEDAVQTLSVLFRASLATDQKFHSLKDELILCERYIELESLRFGNRLAVNISANVECPKVWLVPKLIAQPLIENSIHHGRLSTGAVALSVDVRETENQISIKIVNGKSDEQAAIGGNGIATDNIEERLRVLYDDQFTFRVRDSETKFSVLMRFPKQKVEEQ